MENTFFPYVLKNVYKKYIFLFRKSYPNFTALYGGATVSLQSEYNVTDLSASLGLEGSTSKLILSINSSFTSRVASNVFSMEPIPKVSNSFKFKKYYIEYKSKRDQDAYIQVLESDAISL